MRDGTTPPPPHTSFLTQHSRVARSGGHSNNNSRNHSNTVTQKQGEVMEPLLPGAWDVSPPRQDLPAGGAAGDLTDQHIREDQEGWFETIATLCNIHFEEIP